MIEDIVVRTARERTADECVARLADLFPSARVHRIELAPFVAALKECWRIVRTSEGEWCLTCDGDVLPDERVLKFARRLDRYDGVGMVVPLLDDWLVGWKRPAGLRAYRPGAVPSKVKRCRRPESLSLRRAGVICGDFDGVVGSHDKEQWLRDVYHTVMHHAHKQRRNSKFMSSLGRRRKKRDHPDFVVMDEALKRRHRFRFMDARDYPTAPLDELGLTEKEPLC